MYYLEFNKTTLWSSGYTCDSDEVVILIQRRGHLLSKYFLFKFIPLTIHRLYIVSFYIHVIRFYLTFIISEFSNYTVMERMHYNFAYFPIFILLNYSK